MCFVFSTRLGGFFFFFDSVKVLVLLYIVSVGEWERRRGVYMDEWMICFVIDLGEREERENEVDASNSRGRRGKEAREM